MIYEVAVKIGYCDAMFRFDDGASACEFAESVLSHSVENGDGRKVSTVFVIVKKKEEE